MPVALFHDYVTSKITERQKTAAIFLDLSRAFDTVNIKILLKKLSKYGVTGNAQKLLYSYLNMRTHRLKFNDIVSNENYITCGVPQGSVLGPLLFLIYMNDINLACNEAKTLLFADDTALLYSASSCENLQHLISRSFPRICKWLHANRLSLSIPKTFYQLYAAGDTEELQIPVNSSFLKRSKTVKYLGVLIDEDLKFKAHVNKLASSCSRALGVISRAKQFLNKSLLMLLYNALILPHLSYCSVIWGSNYVSTLKPLTVIQKRAIRIISGASPLAHTSPLFRDLKVLKLTDLIKYQILLVVHDFLFERLPQTLCKFRLCDQNSRTRHVQHFVEVIPDSSGDATPNYRLTNSRQSVLFYKGAVLWNQLIATKIPNLNDVPPSKSLFKKCLKIIFTDSY